MDFSNQNKKRLLFILTMTSRERQRIFLPKTQQHSLNWSKGTLCNNDEMQSVENKQAALLSSH